jgi:hypothetical protein
VTAIELNTFCGKFFVGFGVNSEINFAIGTYADSGCQNVLIELNARLGLEVADHGGRHTRQAGSRAESTSPLNDPGEKV